VGTPTAGGQTFTVTQDGAAPACAYSLLPTGAAPGAAGVTGAAFGVDTTPGCAWGVTSNAGWITVDNAGSGSGDGTVTYSVDANASTTQRVGTLTAGGQTFTVTQDGAAASCTGTLSPTATSVAATGYAKGSFGVSAPGNCAWTAVSDVLWIVIEAGATATGNGTVNFVVQANPETSPRTGTIVAAGQTHTVTQSFSTSPCTFTVSPLSAAAPAAGGSGPQITVGTSGTSCVWTAVSNVPWITVTGGHSERGADVATYTVAPNPGPEPRTGTLTIAGQTFTVTQAGAAEESIEPPSLETAAPLAFESAEDAERPAVWDRISRLGNAGPAGLIRPALRTGSATPARRA
jgi:hypothetical protein